MARYSIMIREYGHDYEIKLAEVHTNPLEVVEAARQRTRQVQGTGRTGNAVMREISRYDHVYALDNETGEVLK